MLKACLALAFFGLVLVLPVRAFNWETATVRGRDYVSLHSFCTFYGFPYSVPNGNDRYVGRNAQHTISMKIGSPDLWLDGVHYVMSFPIEGGDNDWLVSRMDVIKLFEPVLRPTEISGRHSIRGVVLDAGHGGTDNGAVSAHGGMEKRYSLDTAFRVAAILRSAGLKVVFTRQTDVFVDLYERAHIASLYPDYCFVSIHFNSATPEARGLETYCLSPRGAASTSSAYLTRGDIQKLPGNDYDTQNILLASMVHSEIIKLNPGDPSADRGVKRARFVVIKQNVLPAILVEGGFVSNHMEAARIDQERYRQNLAQAIARGIIKFSNSMGDDDRSLPGLGSSDDGDNKPAPPPPPKAVPVAVPSGNAAPSGLAQDSPNVKAGAHAPKPSSTQASADASGKSATTPGGAPTTTSGTGHKSKKKKGTAAATTPAVVPSQAPSTPAPSNGPISPSAEAPSPGPSAPAPTPKTTPAPTNASPQAPSAPLNLAEPAPPTPAPGADKAPAEPDEPPTVNIYPTTPSKTAAPSVPAPSAPAPEPAPAPAAAPGTNAASSTPAEP